MMRNETVFILKIFPLAFNLFPLTTSIKTLQIIITLLTSFNPSKICIPTKGVILILLNTEPSKPDIEFRDYCITEFI